MTKQLIEVDVPDGWRAVGYRVPQEGDAFLFHGNVHHDHCGRSNDYLILEPEWQAPSWIKPGTWLTMDHDGDWWMHESEPRIERDEWVSCDGMWRVDCDIDLFTDFTFPPCTDWRTSKRQIGKAP